MIDIIAHRGASAYEPENTLRAFQRAIELGATMLELDVHLSHDGHPIVMHDANLARTTNGTGQIRDLSLAEIRRLDAGQGEQVPTLDQVIDLVRGRAQLYIELKGQQTPAVVVDTLRRMDFCDQAIAGSFYPWLPQKVKFLEPAIRTSVLVASRDRQADFVDWVLAVGADYVHPCWEHASPSPHELLTPELIGRLRGEGLGIVVWHEERPEELRELVKLDVDGICTNTPDVLAAILEQA
ncbi:MAG TPA: glycerophosphodiester phosphodiesterase family protein [Anaerolineae bacterium]|nr:glycerophosphodiester phosphodiesterase family protein [Anaerolineae bacterium]